MTLLNSDKHLSELFLCLFRLFHKLVSEEWG